jgi:hypothetical protein
MNRNRPQRGGFFVPGVLRAMRRPSFAGQSCIIVGVSRMIDHSDFSVVVKEMARSPKSWGWEIYRAGRKSPIERSDAFFATMTEADRAGKASLRLLLSEYP